MKRLLLLLVPALLAGPPAFAQTKVTISAVKAVDGAHTLQGTDALIQLGRAEGSGSAGILASGDVTAEVQARVSSHNVRRSSVKDSAVNLVLEVTMKAGKDKDRKRVEKIFYMDQARTAAVSQRFNFKQGLTMRPITLLFNIAVE
ncbi:MAG: hypothetical protein KBH07_10230 [Flavobacteriales bacterium]|nr:hypothetical protein [Flavobacteriales bacterium]MBP9080797.1 hypothetical protein [Flavobacteriales bacterium]